MWEAAEFTTPEGVCNKFKMGVCKFTIQHQGVFAKCKKAGFMGCTELAKLGGVRLLGPQAPGAPQICRGRVVITTPQTVHASSIDSPKGRAPEA